MKLQNCCLYFFLNVHVLLYIKHKNWLININWCCFCHCCMCKCNTWTYYFVDTLILDRKELFDNFTTPEYFPLEKLKVSICCYVGLCNIWIMSSITCTHTWKLVDNVPAAKMYSICDVHVFRYCVETKKLTNVVDCQTCCRMCSRRRVECCTVWTSEALNSWTMLFSSCFTFWTRTVRCSRILKISVFVAAPISLTCQLFASQSSFPVSKRQLFTIFVHT